MLSLLRQILLSKGSQFQLCSAVTHTSQRDEVKDNWSCGYRNIQMLNSSLVTDTRFRERLFDGADTLPSVYCIQDWIERAWKAGFDVEVCRKYHSLN
jgi:hypothetical protein